MSTRTLQKLKPFGYWSVTTEGDVEGRTTKNLGTFHGYIDEIAFHLADKCYYGLQFKALLPDEMSPKYLPTKSKVTVSLDISSGTWDLKNEDRKNYFKELLQDRPNVIVKDGASYASVDIELTNSSKVDLLKRTALSKLSDEEKMALGLSN